MPRACANTPSPLRAALLARLELGETLAEVCRSEGMPTTACVWIWARKDGAFWVALAIALAKGAAKRPPKGFPPFDEAQAKRVLARLAEGLPVLAALKAAGGPSWRTFRHWRQTQGEFAEAVDYRLRSVRGTRARRRWRDFDPEIARRILMRVARGEPLRRVLASDRAFPCLAVLDRWRRADPDFAAGVKEAMALSRRRRGARRLWSEELEAAICLRLLHGASLREVARDPTMPCGTTLRNWRKQKPTFARGVAIACDMRDQLAGERLMMMAEAATPETAREVGRGMRPIMGRFGRMRLRR